MTVGPDFAKAEPAVKRVGSVHRGDGVEAHGVVAALACRIEDGLPERASEPLAAMGRTHVETFHLAEAHSGRVRFGWRERAQGHTSGEGLPFRFTRRLALALGQQDTSARRSVRAGERVEFLLKALKVERKGQRLGVLLEEPARGVEVSVGADGADAYRSAWRLRVREREVESENRSPKTNNRSSKQRIGEGVEAEAPGTGGAQAVARPFKIAFGAETVERGTALGAQVAVVMPREAVEAQAAGGP